MNKLDDKLEDFWGAALDAVAMKHEYASVEDYERSYAKYKEKAKQAIKDCFKEWVLEERIDELKRLKAIDSFNEAYTTDPRPAKHVAFRLEELRAEQRKRMSQ